MMLFGDTETYSEADLRLVGAHRYAAHPSTEVLLLPYALGDGPARIWEPSKPMPRDLRAALDRDTVVFHNAQFDRAVLGPLAPPLERWRCSMAKAYTLGLPGSLDALGEALGLSLPKMAEGKRLVRLFCQPGPGGIRATKYSHPFDWEQFVAYALRDVEAMREAWHRMPDWVYTGREIDLWHLDQRINDRGLPIDQELLRACVRIARRIPPVLDAEVRDLTHGAVSGLTKVADIKAWCNERGAGLTDLRKGTIDRVLARRLDPDVRRVLGLRQDAAKASTKKLQAIVNGIEADGRIRGTLQYYGAKRTGRWSGRRLQPQNLPSRGVIKGSLAVGAILNDTWDLLFDSPLLVVSSALRGLIKPPGGVEAADLSNIEGRVLAWEAGERWKLAAFAAYDAGTGPDLYNLAYARSFGVPVESVTKHQRSIGKVQELALGFRGGVNALVSMAAAYGFEPCSLVDPVYSASSRGQIAKAEDEYVWALGKGADAGLTREEYAALAITRSSWRKAHPATVRHWNEVEDAAKAAVRDPGEVYTAGRITYQVRKHRGKAWLLSGLPSGRFLAYPNPGISKNGNLAFDDLDEESGRVIRTATYSGKLTENNTQAIARDVMANGLLLADSWGVPLVTSVHDEGVAEGNSGRLVAALSTLPDWAEGLPLAAAGFHAERYRK